jgi:DNA polymerase-3 subunit alpha
MLFAPPPAEEVAGEDDAPEWSDHDRLAREKESLGFYLSGHPFEKRGAFLARLAGQTTDSLAGLAAKENVRIAGMISSVRINTIKNGPNAGKKMARFILEDLDGQVPVTCFARTYANAKDRITDDAIVFLAARIDGSSDEPALLLDQIEPAEEVVRREVAGLVVHLEGALATDSAFDRIAAVCEHHRGHQHLHLDVTEADHCFRVRCDLGIRVSEALLDDLATVVGPDNMSFTRA